MRESTLLPVVVALCLGACGGPRRTPEEQRTFDDAVARGAVILGMTQSEVRKARGAPLEIDYVEKLGGRVLRWKYAWDEVYFDAKGLVVGTHAAYR